MAAIGVIAEFNPLHKGHEYLLNAARDKGTVVAVISGNFVERGDFAIAEKRVRAEAALRCGADLVVELPTLWAMSTAENFALGGVSILKNIGCEKIIFGSESGEIEKLERTADVLLSEEFAKKIAENKSGDTFAALREAAAVSLGAEAEILSNPNNNLAVEYIKAAKMLDAKLEFSTLKRKGAAHDSFDMTDEFVSATLLREKLRSGDRGFCSKYMSEASLSCFTPETVTYPELVDRAILSVLRTKTIDDLKKLPDISEGIENKLFDAIRLAESTEDLYNRIKVKRYTLARIRRLVLSAFIGADNSFFKKEPPYIRVLGFNKKGEAQLKRAAAVSQVPIVTKVSDIKNLDENAQKVFETECRATDLFALSLKKPLPCGLEYTSKLIKTEN